MKSGFLLVVTFLSLAGRASCAEQTTFTPAETAAIQSFLNEKFDAGNAAMVIGLVDQDRCQVFAAGHLSNGTTGEVDGDSVFFLGSVSKTFTDLLLLEMVERGEVRLDDPAARYLPASVKMPTYKGKEITLFDLATHTAGLPINPDNMTGRNIREEYESYTVEMMYEYLSGYTLPREPGTLFQYSNVGMALLGNVLARRADETFESLIVERICRPLGMDSTCITLSPEMEEHLAMGHDDNGDPSTPWDLQAYSPAGNIHSTANDLLKYAAAQAGLTTSPLVAAIEQSHVIRFQDTVGLIDLPTPITFGRTAMDWVDRGAVQPAGMELLGHAGGAGSYHAWVGFDMKQHRGVVVLSTGNELTVEAVGWTVLQRLPLTPESGKSFAHEIVGIGTALDLDRETQMLRITKVFPNSPAALAGLSAGLFISKVDDVSLAGKSIGESVELLRGPAGSKVRLEVFNAEQNMTQSVEVTRNRFTA